MTYVSLVLECKMKFSNGNVDIEKDRVVISFEGEGESDTVSFERSFYREFAYFKQKKRPEINKWILGGVHLVLLIGWIVWSEYYGNNKASFSTEQLKTLKTLDNIFMPLLMITLLMVVFFDLLADLKVMRFLYSFPFTHRFGYLIIILSSDVEHQIPVKDEKEAIEIVEFFERK